MGEMVKAGQAAKQGSVEVPDNVLVACPMVEFRMRRVAACAECKAFGGLEDRFPGSTTHPFESRYAIKCFGAPVKRQAVAFVKG